MGQVTREGTYRLSTLDDALRAQFPSWVEATPDGARALYVLRGTATGVAVQFPADTADSAVLAVLAAHDPGPPHPTEVATAAQEANWRDLADNTPQMLARCDQILAQQQAGFTAVQRDAAIGDLARMVKRLTKALDRMARQLGGATGGG